MRKIYNVILVALLCLLVGFGALNAQAKDETDVISIVTTIFPEYDWMRSILGQEMENVQLTMLLDSGVDLHSYQPTVDDMIKISTCDMFIYVGGESDEWVEDALKLATNKDMVVINLLEALGDAVKEEEIVEGMEHDREHEDEHEDENEHHHEADEHIWLSLKNAEYLCQILCQKLSQIDPEKAAVYQTNTEAYAAQLKALDESYQQAVAAGGKNTLLFGDRFPFRYLTDDYGLNYYAAFSGCSAESEASFETILFLAEKTDQLGLDVILTIEGTHHNIAQTVASTAAGNPRILALDSLQSTTSKDVENGVTYLSVMEKNLAVLTEALK